MSEGQNGPRLFSACAVCEGHLTPWGRASLRVAGGRVPTEFAYCPRCDLFFRQVTPELQIRRFEAAGYTNPADREHSMEARGGFFRYLLDIVRRRTDGRARSLLDVGASHGNMLLIARQRGFEVAGVEVLQRMRQEIENDLGLLCWSDLREAEGSFDAITFVDSFYYFEDPHGAMRDVDRLLEVDGVVIFRVTNRNWLVRWTHAVSPRRQFDMIGDVVVSWSMKGMRALLTEHGYEILETRFFERGWQRSPARTLVSGCLAALSSVTGAWNRPVALGMTIVAGRAPSPTSARKRS
jgi:SAM-dependent methyltransferase